MSAQPAVVLGIFVGGHGVRMGGVQKALLPAPGTRQPLVLRLMRLAHDAQLPVALIGTAELGVLPQRVLQLQDDPAGIGPLGGLCALLRHAEDRPALCVACDMPYVTGELLQLLAAHPSAAPVLAPRDPQTGKWQPLFARYHSSAVLPVLREALASGERSFQGVFKRLGAGVGELQLTAEQHQQLRDWDTPSDVHG